MGEKFVEGWIGVFWFEYEVVNFVDLCVWYVEIGGNVCVCLRCEIFVVVLDV